RPGPQRVESKMRGQVSVHVSLWAAAGRDVPRSVTLTLFAINTNIAGRRYGDVRVTHSPKEGLIHPGLLFAVRLLTATAIGLAAYLLWVSLSGGAVAGCGPDSSCDKVLHSRWSRWLGLPVSAPGLLMYAGILTATFWLRRKVPPAQQRQA